MKAFIWKNLEKVSERYHAEGGLLVIERDLEQAMNRADEEGCIGHRAIAPDFVMDAFDQPVQVVPFPDAGCC